LFNELPDYSPGKEYIPKESSNFSIVEQKSKYNKHFKAWMIDYNIQINPNVNIEQLNDVLNELLNTIKQRTLFRTGDKLDLVVTNPYLSHPISTRLMTITVVYIWQGWDSTTHTFRIPLKFMKKNRISVK
jgi:hypothetical protein